MHTVLVQPNGQQLFEIASLIAQGKVWARGACRKQLAIVQPAWTQLKVVGDTLHTHAHTTPHRHAFHPTPQPQRMECNPPPRADQGDYRSKVPAGKGG